jgi:hypothetical protein
MIPNGVSSKIGRSILVGQKHSPTLLFAGGVVGVIATTIMASRATIRAQDVIDEHTENMAKIAIATEMVVSTDFPTTDYSEEDRKKDIVIVYSRTTFKLFKLYGPTIMVGALSIAALTQSHHILNRRNAGLTAAYTVLDKAFTEYRRRVINEYGEDADYRFRHGDQEQRIARASQESPEEKAVVRNVSDPSGYARFFDEGARSWSPQPEINLYFLQCQQNYANDLLRARGHLFLNEVYDLIGIDRSSAGSVVGWIISKKGDNYIDFGIFDKDRPRARAFVNGHEPAILLDFNVDGVIYDKIG